MAAQRWAKGVAGAAGKRRWHEDDARAVLRAWERSGQTLSHFAPTVGLKAERLARWAKRLGRPGAGRRGRSWAGAAPLKLRFHPVELVGSATGLQASAIEVVLLDGRRVRVPAGFAGEDLGRVLHVLEECGRC